MEPNEEDGSDEEGGVAAVVPGVPDTEAGAPAPSAATEAAVGPAAAAAENRPAAAAESRPAARDGGQAAGGRGQAPEEGRGRKRRGPEMTCFELGLLAVIEPLAVLASPPPPPPPPPAPALDTVG